MNILKHSKTERLFIATPGLLRNKHLVPASEAEAKEFIAAMDKGKRAELEESRLTKQADLMLPDDVDADVNIQSWGKPQLLALANKINLNVPAAIRVKDLRPFIQSALDELAEKRNESKGKSAA